MIGYASRREMMIAIHIALCAIFGALVAIAVEIAKIAKVVETFERKDGDGSRE